MFSLKEHANTEQNIDKVVGSIENNMNHCFVAFKSVPNVYTTILMFTLKTKV